MANPDQAWLQSTLERYAGFGVKASGGEGDNACGAWLEQALGGFGYRCRRLPFEVPFFDMRRAVLTSGGAEAPVIPQAIVFTTGPNGVSAPLRLAEPNVDLTGAIAVVTLPYKRWAAAGRSSGRSALSRRVPTRRGSRSFSSPRGRRRTPSRST